MTTLTHDPISQFFSRIGESSRGDRASKEELELIVRRTVADYQRARGDQQIQDQVARRFLREYYSHGNEREIENIPIRSFQLAKCPSLNRHIRLFDSGWGGLRWKAYQRFSPTQYHPGVKVSFFDAWVYCKWLRWGGESCRLPWETQWEYAAKLGLENWAQRYWFGDRFDKVTDSSKIVCRDIFLNTIEIATKEPSRERQSPTTGLIDMLGNVSEWCQDRYRFDFNLDLQQSDAGQDAYSHRVARGRCCLTIAMLIRCSYRQHRHPSSDYHTNGVRVSRASSA